MASIKIASTPSGMGMVYSAIAIYKETHGGSFPNSLTLSEYWQDETQHTTGLMIENHKVGICYGNQEIDIVFVPDPPENKQKGHHMITGQTIHDAFTSLETTCKPWNKISTKAKIRYIETAQILNVKTQACPADAITYIFVLDNRRVVAETANLDELATLVSTHTAEDDEFEIIISQNGQETGHGYYAVDPDESIYDNDYPYGTAINLAEFINGKILRIEA